MVGIEGSSIVLRSRRLNRRVIPRLTNAHGFLNPQLSSAYRFLCYLQHQHGTSVPGFLWGALEALDYLPRVKVGRLELSLARWSLSKNTVEALGKEEGYKRFAAVQELRRTRNLPRSVVLQEGDNSLPVDLDNALSVDACVHVMKRGAQATLVEMYPSSQELCVAGPEGHFHHELVVPFVRKSATQAVKEESKGEKKLVPDRAVNLVSREIRVLPAGSEWLYLKLYGGRGSLDDVLNTTLAPLVRKAMASGCIFRWFFVRYADPHDHLRIRFQGNPDRLRQDLLPELYASFNPLLFSGRLWKIEFDTYQREIERYGGVEGILAAEHIFWADSEAVLDVMQELAGDEGLNIRWRIGLLGLDRLLCDFNLDLVTKRTVVRAWRESFQSDFKTEHCREATVG